MKYVGIVALAFLGLCVLTALGVMFNFVTLPFLKFATQVHTNQKIIQKTYDADNAIYNYEWFKKQYEDIQAIENKIKNAELEKKSFETSVGDRKSWTFEDKNEAARLSTVVLGLKNQREDMVADYNARAKMANRSIFQDRLPMFIEL